MATTLPTLTETLNDDFTHTWYAIRPDAIDNILDATPWTLALKEFGSMTPESGGRFITRTIRHGEKSTQNIAKGTVLNQQEVELTTLARWPWKYYAVDVNQSVVDSQVNSGPFKIADYIMTRLGAARDALVQDGETKLMRSAGADVTGKQCNGLYDIITPLTTTANNLFDQHGVTPEDGETAVASDKNGNIARTNPWWRNQYYTGALGGGSATDASAGSFALNLVPVLRNLYNTVTAQLESPNFILMNRDLFEAYEDEVADKQQIVRTSFDQKAADLGFESFTFKGATVTWSSDLDITTASGTDYRDIFMINMNYVELVFDPQFWFEMTDWKSNSNQLEQVAYIMSTLQLITSQPRRHGFATFIS